MSDSTKGSLLFAAGATFLLTACLDGNSSGYTPTEAVAASPAISCSDLTTRFTYANATLTSVTAVAAGATEAAGSTGLTVAMPAYCKVLGKLNQRVSPVDGKTYAISFEMRLPTNWNGRFFHQVNGGTDGAVVAATGDILGGGQTSSGLTKGFSVLSSDAGHASEAGAIGGGVFGIDPQARIDYGYNAVAALTPMAKSLIKTYYAKGPDKSYVVGSSNGGRHAMVAASRFGDQYDGFLAGSPGFNLPKAAVAQLWGVQQYAPISAMGSNARPDITTSFTVADTKLVSDKILAKCDALDGLVDNTVSDVIACQSAFNIATDVPTCSGSPDGTCLTSAQKTVLAAVHAGAKNSAGAALYSKFLWDEGIYNTSSSGFRTWKFLNSTGPRDPLAVAFIFMTPPVSPTVLSGAGTTLLDFALNYNGLGFSVDNDAPKISATNSTYTESSMSFMTPPDLTMAKMVANHGKMILVQGAADPIFSVQDTINWYEGFKTNYGTSATDSARLFIVPGMGHSRGGPATDQYDMVDALVNWVEKGIAPSSVTAKARGTGTIAASSANADVPASWSPSRTRILCPYPAIAKYKGTGSIEDAANFSCQ
ncbi:MAG: tannase/feruloyl esterase family alpha/beta hydrolase [Proteobacteria bacterium]|nr:tannase/feruloyl esterase family alpha/beta hydrolase [Pseudomonadota bacterium]